MKEVFNLNFSKKDCEKDINYCAEPILSLVEILTNTKDEVLKILINEKDREKILRVCQIMDFEIIKEEKQENDLKIVIKKQED